MTEGIEVRGLQLLLYCGVLPEERERPQPIEVDLDLHVDLRTAATTDDLGDTVDYGRVTMDVVQALTAERFLLLERVAGRIVEVVFAQPAVRAVTVSVRKLRPPVPALVATTGVRLHQER